MSVEMHGPVKPKVKDTRPTRKGAVFPVLAAGMVSDKPCTPIYMYSAEMNQLL